MLLGLTQSVAYLRETYGLVRHSSSVWHWIRNGELPACKVLGRWVIDSTDLERVAKRHAIVSIDFATRTTTMMWPKETPDYARSHPPTVGRNEHA